MMRKVKCCCICREVKRELCVSFTLLRGPIMVFLRTRPAYLRSGKKCVITMTHLLDQPLYIAVQEWVDPGRSLPSTTCWIKQRMRARWTSSTVWSRWGPTVSTWCKHWWVHYGQESTIENKRRVSISGVVFYLISSFLPFCCYLQFIENLYLLQYFLLNFSSMSF